MIPNKADIRTQQSHINNTQTIVCYHCNSRNWVKAGKKWQFESHQFRHTTATRMINMGIPLHIIQRYLGHETPTMTMGYAHIHDETLRREIEKYHESRVVNFQGETVELEETILFSNDDLEWFKKPVIMVGNYKL